MQLTLNKILSEIHFPYFSGLVFSIESDIWLVSLQRYFVGFRRVLLPLDAFCSLPSLEGDFGTEK